MATRPSPRFAPFAASILALVGAAIALASCASAPEPIPRAKLDAAWQALAGNDFSEAQKLFRALERSSGDAEAWRGEALALFAQGRLAESERSALRSISADPASPRSEVLREFLMREIPCDDAGVVLRESVFASMVRAGSPVWAERGGLRGQLEIAEYARLNAAALSQAADRMGAVKGWRVIGPYPNPSGNGIDLPFLDETARKHEPGEASARLPKDARSLEWLTIANCGPSGQLFPSGYLGGDAYSVHYAEATWEAGKTGEYWAILDRNAASVKLWLDEAPVFYSPEFTTAQDTAWIPVHLEKGQHRFLAKIGSGAVAASIRLFVRGAPSPAETGAALDYAASIPGMDLPDADPLIAQLAAAYAASKRFEDLFLLSYALARRGHPDSGAALVDAAFPQAGAKPPAFAAWVKDECLSDARDDGVVRSAADDSFAAGFAPREDLGIEQAISCRDWAEAQRRLDASVKSNGEREFSRLFQALIAIGRGGKDGPEAYDAYASDHRTSPELAACVKSFGLQGIDPYKLRSGMDHGLFKYGAAYFGYGRSVQTGDYLAALRDAQTILSIDPARGDIAAELIDDKLYAKSLTYEGFKLEIEKAIKTYPGRAEFYFLASQVMSSYIRAVERADKAKGAELRFKENRQLNGYMEKALAFNPSRYSLRSDIADLNRAKKPDEVYGSFSPFAAIDAYRSSGGAEAGDGVVVRDDVTWIFFADGGSRRYHSYVFKPLSQGSVAAESTQIVGRSEWSTDFEVRSAFLAKADGRTAKAVVDGNRVSFPGLSPGDYIVMDVVENGCRSQAFKDDFWLSQEINEYCPVAERSLTVVYPADAAPRIAIHGAGGIEIAKKESDSPLPGYKQTTFSVAALQAVGYDIPTPHYRDALAWIDVSTVKGWSAISAWYGGSAWGATRPNPALEKKARELTEKARTRTEAIRALFAYVSSSIFYEDLAFQYSAQIPQPAKDIMEDGFGDCKDKATLLIALLRSVGIEAEFGLSASDYRGPSPYLPSDRFNHAIVLLPEGDGWNALDPTGAAFTYPELPDALDGTKVLPISGKTTDLVTLGLGSSAGTVWITQIDASTKSNQVAGTAVLRGIDAARLRGCLGIKDAAARSSFLDQYLAEWIPGMAISETKAEPAAGLSTSPSLGFKGSLDAVLLPSGPGYTLSLPWACALPKGLLFDARSGSRKNPLFVDNDLFRRALRQTFVVKLPPGCVPAGLPKNARFSFKAATARYAYSFANGELVVEREISLPPMQLEASDLDGFRAFVSSALSKQTETIYLASSGASR